MRQVGPLLMERVDLMVLSVRTPVIDAVCATACSRWREASDLWLDVFREPRHRALAAQCGLEATLKAGLYDLAQYFHIGIVERPSLPAFLVEPWRLSLAIRRGRARVHTARTLSPERAAKRSSPQQLIDLALYREAIREVFRRRDLDTDPGAAVASLAACYAALGEHEALIALHRAEPKRFKSRGVQGMLDAAMACTTLAGLGPVENTMSFAKTHPAGALLTPFLEISDAETVRHG